MEKILSTLNVSDLGELVEGVAFKNALKKVPQNLLKIGTDELEKKISPTVTDYFLKNALWNEIRKAVCFDQKILPEHVYTGLCTYTHWFNNILNNPVKLAWMVSPCMDISYGVREVRHWLLGSLHKVFTTKIVDSNGNPNINVIRELVKAGKYLFDVADPKK